MKKPKVLAVVGARSGSKGIPNKNIKPLADKPLMAWIIEAALRSELVTKVIVSTDSAKYASIAGSSGAEVPFYRPAHLSGDNEPDFTYLYHAAVWCAGNLWQPDIILRLPPTSPLCTTESIEVCIQLLIDNPAADSSRTITEVSKHPYKMWKKNGKYIEPFLEENVTGKDAHNMPRQGFPKVYDHVDVIALRWETLVEKKQMAGKKVAFHIIPKEQAIDIDTELDFLVAEALIKKGK